MVAARIIISLLLLVVPSWCERGKSFHSKISALSDSNSRFLFHSYYNGRDRGHDQHHQSHKKQLESTTIGGSEEELSTTIPPALPQSAVSDLSYEKSLPLRVLNCMAKKSILDCGKLYLLQNMESMDYNFETTTNLTHDVQQIFLPSYREPDNKLFEDHLLLLDSTEVDKRINRGLARLFNKRQVDIRFLPGFGLRITPSADDTMEFSIKKSLPSEEERASKDGGGGGGGKKGYKHLIRLGVPVVLLPTMLLAGVMPMMIPVLKFATFFTSFVNHAALAAAVMYLAKQHAQEQEDKQTIYFNAGYN
ncbi:uncharacterized protein LOC129762094 [Toxorhynchites rutilus septentrionalis]|uniref:uncharacterized protein LOC129762094 n=1 Tax=Toxorhynchites rutilus septentrionalis TaxID=329112 RepID=UPI00247AEE2E|nr:uncharacterized protein LOC129762094 [Toxorhynchites rutilus septentrionalis]